MRIGGQDISDRTLVIAEAGSNHNGSIETAMEMIDIAADAGVDAVKFQTFRAENLYVQNTGEEDYFDNDKSLYETMEAMEMPYDWIPKLRNYSEDAGVVFMSTPFDERSADQLEEFVPAYKIASFTVSHHPFLRHVARKGKPVIMSTGSHGPDEIRESVAVLRDAGVKEPILLHCVSSYPTPLDAANVRAVETLRDQFDVPVGLSDHTLDPVTAPAAAVALGASVVEKHFTLDKSMDGPDHDFALEPDELDEMVDAIRKTEKVLGDGTLGVRDAEEELFEIARRRIHAARDIGKGEQISEADVAILRSGKRKKGMAPKYYDELLGRKVTTDIEEGDGITWDEVQ